MGMKKRAHSGLWKLNIVGEHVYAAFKCLVSFILTASIAVSNCAMTEKQTSDLRDLGDNDCW